MGLQFRDPRRSGGERRVVGPDGNFWFTTSGGIGVADPHRSAFSIAPHGTSISHGDGIILGQRSPSRGRSVTNICAGSWVIMNSIRALSATACGVTPQAQKTGTSFA
jgi:hypothetical protein